jgi:DNA-binding transcriptional ArsR family regulator
VDNFLVKLWYINFKISKLRNYCINKCMPKSPFPKHIYHHNAEIYKILAHPIRLEILNSLSKQDLSVEDLTGIIGIRKPTLSQHLAILRHARIVSAKRRGVNVYYHVIDPRIILPCKIFYNIQKMGAFSKK